MIAELIGGGLAQRGDPLWLRNVHPTRVKHRKQAFLPLVAVLALGGCAVTLPSGPAVLAVPGQGKTLEAFQQDDVACRQYASERVGAGVAQASSAGLQRQYDMAYLQCMVAKGNTVPSLAAPPGPGYYAPYRRY